MICTKNLLWGFKIYSYKALKKECLIESIHIFLNCADLSRITFTTFKICRNAFSKIALKNLRSAPENFSRQKWPLKTSGALRTISCRRQKGPLKTSGALRKTFCRRQNCPLKTSGALRKIFCRRQKWPLKTSGALRKIFWETKMALKTSGALRKILPETKRALKNLRSAPEIFFCQRPKMALKNVRSAPEFFFARDKKWPLKTSGALRKIFAGDKKGP